MTGNWRINVLVCYVVSARRQWQVAIRSNSTQTSKITTHHTIVPRETDERWKGNHFEAIFKHFQRSTCSCFINSSMVVRYTLFAFVDVDMTRYSDATDVLIIGGGPAGLSAAIRLKQLATEQQKEITVRVVEKAAEVGS